VTLEVISGSSDDDAAPLVLVHLDVVLDGPARRAAKRAQRAAQVALKHREKKQVAKACKRAARAENAQRRAQEEEQLRQMGRTKEQIAEHFRAAKATQHAAADSAASPAAAGDANGAATAAAAGASSVAVPRSHSVSSTRAARAQRTKVLSLMSTPGVLPRVVVDCSFDSVMTLQEVCSLAKQIKYIYGHNMRSAHPVHLVLAGLQTPPSDFDAGAGWGDNKTATTATSTTQTAAHAATAAVPAAAATALPASSSAAAGSAAASALPSPPPATAAVPASSAAAPAPAARPVMYTRALLERLDGFSRLALSCSTEDYMACEQSAGVPPERVVYLTAESPTLLTRLDPKVSYVIGGLVDHNRLKNLCHSNALARGVATARLPIGENMTSNGRRTVITVNQVFEILLRAHEQQQQLADGKTEPDWAAIMKSVLPARSNWQEKRPTAAAAPFADASASAAAASAGADAEEDEEERADDERNELALEQDEASAVAVVADADAIMADGTED
jgi:hypothetical protein